MEARATCALAQWLSRLRQVRAEAKSTTSDPMPSAHSLSGGSLLLSSAHDQLSSYHTPIHSSPQLTDSAGPRSLRCGWLPTLPPHPTPWPRLPRRADLPGPVNRLGAFRTCWCDMKADV